MFSIECGISMYSAIRLKCVCIWYLLLFFSRSFNFQGASVKRVRRVCSTEYASSSDGYIIALATVVKSVCTPKVLKEPSFGQLAIVFESDVMAYNEFNLYFHVLSQSLVHTRTHTEICFFILSFRSSDRAYKCIRIRFLWFIEDFFPSFTYL